MDEKPFLHEHHLLYDKYRGTQEACCDKCKLQINGGAFSCEICKFWLHKSCALKQLPHKISHPLHSQHLLTLHYGFFSYFCCDKCFSLTRGCMYSCNDCNFNLDLMCASSSFLTTTNDENPRPKTIRHFSHFHELTPFKYRKVDKYHHGCYWCHNLLLSGLISYGCLDSLCFKDHCFFHESCLIDMPITISKHHFHPSHPLYFQQCNYSDLCNACEGDFRGYFRYKDIDSKDGGYSCQKCGFNLHVGCVTLQPSLKHELHQHHLTYFQRKLSYHNLQCQICSRPFDRSNGFYHCMQCNFNIHLHCLQVPLRTKHEYHRHELVLMGSYVEDVFDEYYCDMCEKQRKPKHPVYICEKCSFVAHVGCALYKFESTYNLEDNNSSIWKPKQEETEQTNAKTAKSLSLLQIENFHPQHPLSFTEVIEPNESICCRACNIGIFDQAYACKRCKYYLHKTCTALPYEVLHPLHPQHSLKLFTEPKFIKVFACCECGDSFVGFLYVCFRCDFALDVKCAIRSVSKIKNPRLKDMETRSKLCPFNQDHQLQFSNFVPNNYTKESCGFCDLPLEGPSYGCISCSLQLHESCLEFPYMILLQFHLHPFYPLCGGYISRRRLRRKIIYNYNHCHVCRDDVKDIRYSCLQCDLHLHPRCIKYLKRTIRSKVHMHDLYYYCNHISKSPRNIHIKDSRCIECKGIVPFNLLYFCLGCDIKLHFECAQLPHSIQSKYHMHPLTLKSDLTEDDFEEFYCDICEGERNPKDHVYSCIECEGLFAAHMDCGLNTAEETALAL